MPADLRRLALVLAALLLVGCTPTEPEPCYVTSGRPEPVYWWEGELYAECELLEPSR